MCQASFLLDHPSHYKMLLKSQVKLINDCPAISKATYLMQHPQPSAFRKTLKIIGESVAKRE
ncbi:hypothetical protein BZP36_11540 [Raoultella terrigena]|nr:hypothetical protein BZP36_11540 [Raoultella terrigena]HCR56750.1 hypothetical protein [Raoultella sp.]